MSGSDRSAPLASHRGIWQGAAAYGIWGLFPLYFKHIGHVPALQVLAHRIVWSFVTLSLVLAATRRLSAVAADANRRVLTIYAAAALLICVNWFIYVWAVAAGYVIETSLGYFITPLVNVLLGVLMFRERLRSGQWAAVAIAAVGVAYLAVSYGALPWISLVLAFTFGSYGLMKKKAPLSPMHGLMFETGMLFLPAACYLAFVQARGTASLFHVGPESDVLLLACGAVTLVPLLLFASAVHRIPLSTLGILQYIAPTLQFLLGVLVYREAFSRTQFAGFVIVWAALVVFVGEGLVAARRERALAASSVV